MNRTLLSALLCYIATNTPAAAEGRVVACETQGQIFAITHMWKYYGLDAATIAFGRYFGSDHARGKPVCSTVEISQLQSFQLEAYTMLPYGAMWLKYAIYESVTITDDTIYFIIGSAD
jgi:hypothetical protein